MLPLGRLTLVLVSLLLYLEAEAKPKSCAFYCFVAPSRKETVDVAVYKNLSCTHFVYGFARIRPDMSLHSVTSRDSLELMSPGNMRKFLGLRETHPDAILLLGVHLTANDVFEDFRHARRIAGIIATAAKEKHFDGVFVRMEGPTLESTVSQHFLSAISLSPSSSATTLAITPRWMWRVANRLNELADQVDHLYLDMEELPTSEDLYAVTHIDPLFPFDTVPLEDTISGCSDRLLKSGVPAEKIVMGLNSGGRTFKVRDPKTTVHGDVAVQTGIRRSLQDVCQSPFFTLHPRTASAVTESRSSWTTVNIPKEQSLGRKILWVTQEGLGGIGLSSLHMDDPKGKCGAGPYPSHSLVAKLLKCRNRDHRRLPPAQCTRLCYLDEHAEDFDPKLLEPHWCSHIVLGPADIHYSDAVEVNPDVRNLISRVNNWANEIDGKRPMTLLSIGARQGNEVWRMEVGNALKRKNLINSIKATVRAMNVSGIDISWTREPLDGLLDTTYLSQFLTDLRTVLPRSIAIYVSVNPTSSFDGRYDVNVLNKTAEFVILQTHRLHSPNLPTTGHHSAMFPAPGLKDNRMTVESFVRDWISRGIARHRLIVSVTATPITMKLVQEGPAGQFLGLSTVKGSTSSEPMSQSEICNILEIDNATEWQSHWLDGISAPVLIRGTDFVAYDNDRSAKIKTTWSSSNNLAGMAIHGLPYDNPEAECPSDRPFRILQAIVDTQVCSLCAPESKSESRCSPSFHTTCDYRLQEHNEARILDPAQIPFELCTELIIEQALIDANGTIRFPTEEKEETTNKLKSYRSRVPRMTISMFCDMKQEDFKQLMRSAAKRRKLASSIRTFIDRLSFNGVEIRCGHLAHKTTKLQFSYFLRLLNNEMKRSAKAECGNTVSFRTSAWDWNLREFYDVTILNSLHHIVIEPFTVPYLAGKAYAHSPLFKVDLDDKNMSITSIYATIRDWEKAGLMRSKIILQVPSYGSLQYLLNKTEHGIGKPTEKEYGIIAQSEICQQLKLSGTTREIHWDSMTVDAYSGRKWISIEDQQTVRYKMRFALGEGLAGVGLMTLNEDDFLGKCGSGAFPILRSIAARCH
ncbi:unnamed protein product [Cylicocyclus nassatus]|uniref:GH18 domain-containing protein n=1 Tax=Cylicocyclus nassatus TaxID=53992 RepID=A0AA36H634_CYLNA|nr:unnamed protein product [Cylicocyclus nassatus]